MKEFEKQRAFLQMLQAVLKQAQKNRNTVTRQQLDKAFEGMELSEQQLQQIEDYLKANNIGIDEPPALEDVLTEEEHNYLQDYEDMIRSLPVPDPGVLQAVKISSMAGEKDAQEQLVQFMLPQVVDIAKLYAGQGVYMEDLIGAGNLELVQAVTLLGALEKADEVEGALAKQIMNAMEDLIAENLDQKAADADAVQKANLVLEKADELASMLGRRVSVSELANEGDVTEDDIVEAIRFSGGKIDSIESEE